MCVCVSAHKERTVAGWQSAWFQFVLVHMENELFAYYTSLFAFYFIIIVTFFSSFVILFCAQFSTTICSHQSVCIVHPNVINRKKATKICRDLHILAHHIYCLRLCFSIALLLANSLFGLAPYFTWWIVSVEFTLSNLNHPRCALDEQQLLLRLFFLAGWIVLVAHYLSKCKMKIASKRKRKNTDGLTHGKNKLIL